MMLKRFTPVLLAVCALGFSGAPAFAVTAGPGWELTARSYPTNLPPGGSGLIEVDVANVGASPSTGTVTVTDTLPPGLIATNAGDLNQLGTQEIGHSRWDCMGSTVVTCTNDPEGLPSLAGGGGGPTRSYIGPDRPQQQQIAIAVSVLPGARVSETNQVTIAGGSAPAPASTTNPVTISPTSPGFGFVGLDGWFSNADGTLDTQAGSHPYELTISFDLANVLEKGAFLPAGGEARDIEVGLPPGIVGDPNAVPRCTRQELNVPEQEEASACPQASQVGVAAVTSVGGGIVKRNIFNMVPPPGVAAEFAFSYLGINTFLDSTVRTGGDYGITTHVNNSAQRAIVGVVTTLWGVPGDPSHLPWRGTEGGCSQKEIEDINRRICKPVGVTPRPLLTLPSSCASPQTSPQTFSIRANTWRHPETWAEASFLLHDSNGDPTGFTGCEALGFGLSLTTFPDTSRADTPAGLTVDVRPQLGGLLELNGVGASDIRDTTVTLPEGLVVNPGQATGLAACQPSQDGVGTEGPASCPPASRVGTAQISSPALSEVLEGGVYVLQSNPPDIQLLVAGSAEGVNIKLVGYVHLDETTGRLTTTLHDLPQQPVSDVKLTFNGGPQAALITPRACGVYTTTSDFTPWSTPLTPDAFPTAQFTVESGVGGGPCSAGEPFAPSMTAGTVSNQAGAFSPLSVTFSRQDQEQDVSGVSVTIPPGLLAMLKSVERCGEPEAGQGVCGPGSLIGHTTVAVGAGPDPFYVQGGQVFFTGPYRGAPFGLSVVVPAVAGPFNLGNIVVRAAISIDPHTAQPTITSDPFPTILDGVPLQLKTVNVTIDRQAFMFNPTSCEPLSVTGSLTSTQGATANVLSRFQAANCQGLPFKPSFTVSTQAKTGKKQGASLDVKVGYPKGAQANIRAVAVSLPKQLPARLTTIQQACLAAVFNANPAACPAGSNIGVATASTPVLASPVSGPAYLVSHGGAAFPDLVVVLQGEGITLDLVGSINIKHGVTSSTFASVPDAPIGSFELKLPEGPHSGLAAVVSAKAKGNMCGQTLAMPTTITGQNGAVVKQATKIAVTGCPKAKKKPKAKHHKKKKGGKK
jgi:hypothetical protein